MEDLVSILPGMVKAMPDVPEIRRSVIFVAWNRAIGEGLRGHSAPIDVVDKTLFVSVRDEEWNKEFLALSPQIIFKINGFLGEAQIKFIEYTIDPSGFKDTQVAELLNKQDIDLGDLEEEINKIEDENLRESVFDAARSYLTRQKNGR